MANEKISGAQKAAIFLFSLGEDLASNVIKQLTPEEIRKIGAAFSRISKLTPNTVDEIMHEFQEDANMPLPIQVGKDGGTHFLKNVVSKAVDKDKAKSLIEDIQDEAKSYLFQNIKQLDPRTVALFLRAEHPQTIAIVLTHLDSLHAAEIIEELPPAIQANVVTRIAELENIPPGIVEEIDEVLKQEISAIKGGDGHKRGGVGLVAEILNQVNSKIEGQIMKDLEEQKQGLAEEIRKLMFVFEDLLKIDDRSILAILKEIDNENLMKSLKTASEGLKEKIFKNMSERASQMLKEDIEVMGPLRLKDVEAAQQAILKVAKRLETEGKIVLMSKGKEEVFV